VQERERERGGGNVINTLENSVKAAFRDVDSAHAASGSPKRASREGNEPSPAKSERGGCCSRINNG